MIEIRMLNKDYLSNIRKAAMNTIGKKNIEESQMSPELFYKYLISEHSPIRAAFMEVIFRGISYPSSVHFARHVHTTHYVTTSRPDRTGKERSTTRKVDHMMVLNLQALTDMMRKRLCIGKVEKETYEWALSLKMKLMNSADPYLQMIGKVLVPNGVYKNACTEFKSCGFCINAVSLLERNALMSITNRYDAYNDFLREKAGGI